MDKRVLLIADDEKMNRVIIKKFLKNDYEVIEAENGKEAVETLKSRHVDALLLDIIMPEMDGLEVLECIGKEESLQHVGILVATSTKEKTERTALSLGADDVVSKPYDPIVIRKRMQNILAMKKMREQNPNAADVVTPEMIEQVAYTMKKIIKFTNLIDANKENTELMTDIVQEIRNEAEGVATFISAKE